mgnify:CR=1 FL=1
MSNPKRIVIVGGVAGGMSTATRMRRLDEQAHITVIEKSGHVSYANCGLPYFVGGVIENEADLLLQTPERLFARFRIEVKVDTEVVGIDAAAHSVTVRHGHDGSESTIEFDKLVLSPGALPVRPPIPGFDRVRVLRTVEDANRLWGDVSAAPASAVVIGAGIAAGFAYWAVAGWSAGFWKPVFAPPSPPQLPPQSQSEALPRPPAAQA